MSPSKTQGRNPWCFRSLTLPARGFILIVPPSVARALVSKVVEAIAQSSVVEYRVVISDDIARIDGIRCYSRYHNTQVSAIDRVVFNGVVVRSSITILVIWFDSISKKPAKTSSSFANP